MVFGGIPHWLPQTKRRLVEDELVADQGDQPCRSARVANGTEPERTADEQSVLDTLVRVKRRPLSREEENLALEQARMMGNLE
jgi:hypothetical protein